MVSGSAELSDVLCLSDLETLASTRIDPIAFAYVASGAADEVTIAWNRSAYDRIALRPRVLAGVESPETAVTILGTEMAFPILLAPTAYHKVLHPDGELETARGASRANVTWIVGSGSNTAIEDVAREASSPLWFQLYFQSDREFTKNVIQRAVEAGCRALCLTVDTSVTGPRNRQTRSGFALPPGVETPHLCDTGSHGRDIMDPRRLALSWKDVEWVRSIAGIPVVLKGILTADDARLAVELGVEGIIVSNHGGRNLDTAIASIDALPEVVEEVGDRIPVLVDGGIRRGTDVLKALALGARAVLIGRPYCYGLSLWGAAGVQRTIEILRRELEMAMILTGRARLSEIDRSLIART